MKDCTTCKYGFVDEQLGFPMCHHPSRRSEDCIDFNMHEEVEESAKTTGIEEKKLPDGLEEAASKYISTYYANHHQEPDMTSLFIAGAEWMEAKMMADAKDGYVSAIVIHNDGDEEHYAVTYPNGERQHSITDKVKIIIL